MEYRQLGASGLFVPELCFGTATFGGTTEFFKKWGIYPYWHQRQNLSLNPPPKFY